MEESKFKAGKGKEMQNDICPCCKFPTLTERAQFEICYLCNWEDDGQDDENANLILGGPNHDYSLTEARANFRLYLTKFRPSDKQLFQRSDS